MEFNFSKTDFNLDILVLTRQNIKQMIPVTKLDIFEPSSQDFSSSGLFSTEIFGMVGSEERNSMFSYTDLHIKVFHPLIYKHLISLKGLYKDVLAGKKYVVFDKTTKDLVLSDEVNGFTGFEYFLSVMDKIKLVDNDSDIRGFKIMMLERYGSEEDMLDKFLVIPAGLRDYKINKNGRPEEDEINNIYRKLLAISSSIASISITKSNIDSVDSIRFKLQETVLELYEYIIALLKDKRGRIQGKWGSRGILYGTRNVITPSISDISDLNDNTKITIEHTTVGLYQYSRAITPITMNRLHSVFIGRIFNLDNSNAYLVNPKTMEHELVTVKVKSKEAWLTLDGLDATIGSLGQEGLRKLPIMVDKHYLLLLHEDNGVITPVFDTHTMPEDMDIKKLRPITYYELLYIALLDTFDTYRGLLTRYPVINLGGIYPSKLYIKTTFEPKKRIVKLGLRELVANEYPNFKAEYYNSMSPHYAFINALGADYDGDKMSLSVVLTKDAITEIDKLLSKKEFYLSPNNELVFSPDTGTLEFLISALVKGRTYAE